MESENSALSLRTTIQLFSLLFILLSACSINGPSLPEPSPIDLVEKVGNAMLIRHNSWLYRIGGMDDSGRTSALTTMATIDEDGNVADLRKSTSLPGGIRNGVAFAAGNFIYILGGRNDAGLVSAVYYALINADGTPGFGSDKHWESNLRPLPEGRASAAWVLRDGWIYLIGGSTPSGATNSIIRARIYQDGQIGHWYGSREILPIARWGMTTAILGDRLYIAGGANSTSLSADMLSFSFGVYGDFSDRRIEPDLPLALHKAILLADGDDLILAGGYGETGWSSNVYRYHDGVWSDTSLRAKAEGSFYGQMDGVIYYLPQQIGDYSEIGKLEGLSLAPVAPTLLPGSGMVPVNSPVLVDTEPGTTIRYRTDGEAPTISDQIWPDTLVRISTETLPGLRLSLAAFVPDGTRSPVIHREYRVRSHDLFIVISGTLPVYGPGYADMDLHSMQTSGAEEADRIPTSAIWYRVRIDTAGDYCLSWADADENPEYSARLMLSVYEADLYTEVPDLNGTPAYDRRDGLALPLHLALGSGDYFIHIREIDGQEGSNFGLSFFRE